MLLEQYGPEVYQKMTSSFDPDGVAAALRSAGQFHLLLSSILTFPVMNK